MDDDRNGERDTREPFPTLPHVSVDAFTADQMAKLKILGIEPSKVERTIDLPLVETKLSDRGDDGWMVPTAVTHYRCPVISLAGAECMILPDGSICDPSAP